MRGQNWSFTGRVLSCLASLFVKSLHITNCWRSCLWSTSGKLVPTLELCPTLQNPFICPRGLLYLACIVGVQWRSFFVFLSTGISSNSSINYSWLTSMLGPDRKIPHPTNSLSCEEHAIPFFWTNLEMFFVSLARTRCSISVPTFPKRSSAKKVYNSCHWFAWLPSMGSNILSTAASPCDRTRDWSEMSFVPCPRVEHVLLQFVLHFWVEYNT